MRVPASVNDFFVIRFAICAKKADEKESEEKEDVVKAMEKRHAESLQQKRSFFVRMVSDPKLYNPKIVKLERRHRLLSMDTSDTSPRFRRCKSDSDYNYVPF